MAPSLDDRGVGNEIYAGENIQLSGYINGSRNRLFFAGSREPSTVYIELNGNENFVQFKQAYAMKGLYLAIGSHIPAHRTSLQVGENLSIETGGRILLYTSGGSLSIGSHCMFSSDITFRCGESPHLLFDIEGRFLDSSKEITIGDHVWIGEGVYLTKSSSIATECVIGARSVVTRPFREPHCAIAGNPATVVRPNVQWIRNRNYLVDGSTFKASHDAFHAAFDHTVQDAAAASTLPALGAPSESTETILMRKLLLANQAIDTRDTTISHLENALHALEQSTSWRLTRPLRALKSFLSSSRR